MKDGVGMCVDIAHCCLRLCECIDPLVLVQKYRGRLSGTFGSEQGEFAVSEKADYRIAALFCPSKVPFFRSPSFKNEN